MKRLLAFILLLVCGLSLTSCGNDEKENNKVTIYFGGSTSVESIAKELTANFAIECPSFEAVHNHTGSGDAYKRTQGSEKNSENKLHIGFLSRELKSSEATASGTSGLLCKDGIVSVTNPDNTVIDDVTAEDLVKIYSSESITWEALEGNLSESFDRTKNISRYTRDASSGTRDGFFTAIGFEEAKTDDTKILGASIVSSNGDMIAKLKNDKYGIGYISLASLEKSNLKALSFNGVAATVEGVVDGSYGLQRNFNYCTRAEDDCTEEEWLMIRAFIAYTKSKEGLAVIKNKDGILTESISDAKMWSEILDDNPEFKEICF